MPIKDETLKKAVNKVVDELLGETKDEEKVEKAMPATMPENGGKDQIKSGTPYSEKKSDKVKKSDEEEEDKETKVEKSEEETKEDKVEKSEETTEEDKVEKSETEEETKVQKSIEELSDVLDTDELELIKAWRADQEEVIEDKVEEKVGEEVAKSMTSPKNEEYEELKKAYSDQTDLIKSLTDKVEKMASQPAYDKKSIETLETIEKSGSESEETISKAQVLNRMLELQKADKGIRAVHVSEFEATNNISDSAIKKMVMDSFKK